MAEVEIIRSSDLTCLDFCVLCCIKGKLLDLLYGFQGLLCKYTVGFSKFQLFLTDCCSQYRSFVEVRNFPIMY